MRLFVQTIRPFPSLRAPNSTLTAAPLDDVSAGSQGASFSPPRRTKPLVSIDTRTGLVLNRHLLFCPQFPAATNATCPLTLLV